jgi:hypothetical protein
MLLRPEQFRVEPFEDATPLLRDPAGLRVRAAEQGYLFLPGVLTGIVVPPDVTWASRPVRPGDVVIFDALTVHAAWSNISPSSVRVSFDIRYVPRSLSAGSSLLSSDARSKGR